MSKDGAELPVAQEGRMLGYGDTTRHKVTMDSGIQKSDSSGNTIVCRWLIKFLSRLKDLCHAAKRLVLYHIWLAARF